jgi:hypothetical protein
MAEARGHTALGPAAVHSVWFPAERCLTPQALHRKEAFLR